MYIYIEYIESYRPNKTNHGDNDHEHVVTRHVDEKHQGLSPRGLRKTAGP